MAISGYFMTNQHKSDFKSCRIVMECMNLYEYSWIITVSILFCPFFTKFYYWKTVKYWKISKYNTIKWFLGELVIFQDDFISIRIFLIVQIYVIMYTYHISYTYQYLHILAYESLLEVNSLNNNTLKLLFMKTIDIYILVDYI